MRFEESGREWQLYIILGRCLDWDEKLPDAFTRLFSLSMQKQIFIADMGCWDGFS